MIAGVDSAYAPSAASLISAKKAGVKLWAGYFNGPNIYHGWSKNDFTRVKETGLATLAYCSGYADPAAMKAQSASWDVPICLDVEGGIRGDGPWVPGWLYASGSGLYGLGPVHRGLSAPFHVVCYYPGTDPKLTWPTPAWWPQGWGGYVPKPANPAAWQWNNSHQNYGANIDSCWMDDGFVQLFGPGTGTIGGDNLDLSNPQDAALIYRVAYGLGNIPLSAVPAAQQAAVKGITPLPQIKAELDALKAEVDQLKAASPTDIGTKIDALAKHLGVGTP